MDGQFSESPIIRYDYDDVSIRLWLVNHDVIEYNVSDIGQVAFTEMKRLADMGSGLMGYILRSKHISAVEPRRWKEWL
jgi:hypothetical protein